MLSSLRGHYHRDFEGKKMFWGVICSEVQVSDILRLVIIEKCEVKINRVGSIEISEIMTIASRVDIFGI